MFFLSYPRYFANPWGRLLGYWCICNGVVFFYANCEQKWSVSCHQLKDFNKRVTVIEIFDPTVTFPVDGEF